MSLSPVWIQAILAIASIGGAALVTALMFRANRDNVDADTSAITVESAGKWVDRQDSHIDRLEQRVSKLETQLRRYAEWARMLAMEVVEAGGTPTRLDEIE